MYFVVKNREVFGYEQISKLVDISPKSIETRVNAAIRKGNYNIVVRNEKIFFNKVSQKENLHTKLIPATSFKRYKTKSLDLVLEKCKKGHLIMTYSYLHFVNNYPENVCLLDN